MKVFGILLGCLLFVKAGPATEMAAYKGQFCTDPRTMTKHAAYTEWADAYSCTRHRCQPGGRNLAIYTVGCKRVEAPESAIECEEVVEDTNMQFPYCCTRLRCLVVVRGEVWTRVLGQPWETLPAAPWSHMYKMKKPPPSDGTFLPKTEEGPVYELQTPENTENTGGEEKVLRSAKATPESPDCNDVVARAAPLPPPDIVIALSTGADKDLIPKKESAPRHGPRGGRSQPTNNAFEEAETRPEEEERATEKEKSEENYYNNNPPKQLINPASSEHFYEKSQAVAKQHLTNPASSEHFYENSQAKQLINPPSSEHFYEKSQAVANQLINPVSSEHFYEKSQAVAKQQLTNPASSEHFYENSQAVPKQQLTNPASSEHFYENSQAVKQAHQLPSWTEIPQNQWQENENAMQQRSNMWGDREHHEPEALRMPPPDAPASPPPAQTWEHQREFVGNEEMRRNEEKKEEKPGNLQALVDAIGTRMRDIESVVARMSEKVHDDRKPDPEQSFRSADDGSYREGKEGQMKKANPDNDHYKRFSPNSRSKYVRTIDTTTEQPLFVEDTNLNGYFSDASNSLINRRSPPKEPAATYMAPVVDTRRKNHASSSDEVEKKHKKKVHKKKHTKGHHKKHQHKEDKRRKFRLNSVELDRNAVSLEDSSVANSNTNNGTLDNSID